MPPVHPVIIRVSIEHYLKIVTRQVQFNGRRLARISHQAAQVTDKALARWSIARITKNTVCYSSMPITVQAGLRVRKLALHSYRSYCYAFRFRAALTNTNPAPAPRSW
jgi:hypothetical protein